MDGFAFMYVCAQNVQGGQKGASNPLAERLLPCGFWESNRSLWKSSQPSYPSSPLTAVLVHWVQAPGAQRSVVHCTLSFLLLHHFHRVTVNLVSLTFDAHGCHVLRATSELMPRGAACAGH